MEIWRRQIRRRAVWRMYRRCRWIIVFRVIHVWNVTIVILSILKINMTKISTWLLVRLVGKFYNHLIRYLLGFNTDVYRQRNKPAHMQARDTISYILLITHLSNVVSNRGDILWVTYLYISLRDAIKPHLIQFFDFEKYVYSDLKGFRYCLMYVITHTSDNVSNIGGGIWE